MGNSRMHRFIRLAGSQRIPRVGRGEKKLFRQLPSKKQIMMSRKKEKKSRTLFYAVYLYIEFLSVPAFLWTCLAFLTRKLHWITLFLSRSSSYILHGCVLTISNCVWVSVLELLHKSKQTTDYWLQNVFNNFAMVYFNKVWCNYTYCRTNSCTALVHLAASILFK